MQGKASRDPPSRSGQAVRWWTTPPPFRRGPETPPPGPWVRDGCSRPVENRWRPPHGRCSCAPSRKLGRKHVSQPCSMGPVFFNEPITVKVFVQAEDLPDAPVHVVQCLIRIRTLESQHPALRRTCLGLPQSAPRESVHVVPRESSGLWVGREYPEICLEVVFQGRKLLLGPGPAKSLWTHHRSLSSAASCAGVFPYNVGYFSHPNPLPFRATVTIASWNHSGHSRCSARNKGPSNPRSSGKATPGGAFVRSRSERSKSRLYVDHRKHPPTKRLSGKPLSLRRWLTE